MIALSVVLKIHDRLIERYGGIRGVRDEGGIASAINRPYQTFDGQELYPTPAEKAAAIFESVITNHPFLDGNKRTAYALLRITLRKFGFDITHTKVDKFEFSMKAAKGEASFEEIKSWITSHCIMIQKPF